MFEVSTQAQLMFDASGLRDTTGVNSQTYILQVELELLLVGFELAGQLVALVVEGKQTLKEG